MRFSKIKMTNEERDRRIQELEFEIEKKRSQIDIKFGPGAFDRGIASLKPHRCAKHFDELFFGFSQFEFLKPSSKLFKCFLTKEELPLLYPEATNSMFDTTELERLKMLQLRDKETAQIQSTEGER